jgi:hypothetical protein
VGKEFLPQVLIVGFERTTLGPDNGKGQAHREQQRTEGGEDRRADAESLQ